MFIVIDREGDSAKASEKRALTALENPKSSEGAVTVVIEKPSFLKLTKGGKTATTTSSSRSENESALWLADWFSAETKQTFEIIVDGQNVRMLLHQPGVSEVHSGCPFWLWQGFFFFFFLKQTTQHAVGPVTSDQRIKWKPSWSQRNSEIPSS